VLDEAVGVGVDERWSPAGLQNLRSLYEPLRRFAAVIGRWDVEPDDLVQEAYTRVLRHAEHDIDDLGPYLRRAIVNLATDERRRALPRAGAFGSPRRSVSSAAGRSSRRRSCTGYGAGPAAASAVTTSSTPWCPSVAISRDCRARA
jgi:DNA-directed RNA polymerase specialized sigma24 family protein